MSNWNSGSKPQGNIIPTAYDDNNWKLWADEKVEGGNSVPSLKISVAKNQPRITVYTGRKDQQGRAESIWARMSSYAFYNLLAILEQVAKGKPGQRFAMKNEKVIDDRNNPGKKKQITESTTWVGKNDDGSVYIAVTAYQKPNIQFVFKPPRFHALVDESGQPLQIGVVSPLCALEFVRIHRAVLPSILATNFDGESRSVSNGGNNSYNRNNNNGGGNRNAGNGQYNGNSNASSSASAAPDTRWDAPSANDDDDPSIAFDGLAF
ncbi:hypothetical protein ACI5OW_003247 [Salmonella enterica subsp. enterica serovar Schwarzengrund]